MIKPQRNGPWLTALQQWKVCNSLWTGREGAAFAEALSFCKRPDGQAAAEIERAEMISAKKSPSKTTSEEEILWRLISHSGNPCSPATVHRTSAGGSTKAPSINLVKQQKQPLLDPMNSWASTTWLLINTNQALHLWSFSNTILDDHFALNKMPWSSPPIPYVRYFIRSLPPQKKKGSSRAAKVAVWNLLRCFMNWGFSWSSHQLLGLWDLVVEVMKLARHLELWTKPLLWNLHHLVFQKACTVEIAHQKDPFGNHSDCKRWQSNRIKRTRINHSQSPIALRWDSTCLTYLAWTSNCF